MRGKKIHRLLSILLVVVMLLSVLPGAVFAVDDTNSSSEDPYKIVHLDCGRKYFTKDWIVALINEIAADGYTHLELAIGNDGLRFLLDDMSVTANNTTYASDSVKAGIQAGNKAYYDFGTNELTETEMDEIFDAANKAGIGIIPLINTPGHMDAIVTAMTNLGISNPNYNGSKTTIDLDNSVAVNFTKELVKKYATYFMGKGCSIFNMGCDEYANDIYTSGSMGFGNLVSSGKYGNFVTYVNDLAAIIKQVGMTPMAFNDGFYFNGNTSSGTFDTDIMISFWTSGWDGYQSETAAQLSTRGHKMINTNGDYYYVLGKNDAFTTGNTTTHDASLYTAASTFSNTQFMGSTVSNPAGSMFCIWCDYPNAETETEIAANVRLTLRAMGARMAGESIENLDTTTVVTGGFNADGSINSETSGGGEESTEPEYTEVRLTVGDQAQETIKNENAGGVYTDFTNPTGIASVVAEYKQVSGGTVEEKATTISSGSSYYIKNSSGQYLNSNCDWVDTIDSAALWIATSSGSGYTLNTGSYYLRVTYSTQNRSWSLSTTNSSYIATTWRFANGTFSYESFVSTYTLGDTYTSKETDPVDETTVTFTGLKPGVTTVQVGSVYYKIIVDYKIVDVSLVLDGTVTKTQTNEITDTPEIADSSIVDVTVNGKQVIFKAKAVGTTTVTVGDTKYNVTVSTEDLSDKSQTIEYWITNGRPTDANGSNEYSVQAAMVGVNSEKGVDVGSLLPENTTKETRTLQFWRCRLLDKTLTNSSTSGTEEQTETAGDDETYNGVEFTRIRYWNGTWSVYTENNEWIDVTANYQLVAYYLEILPVSDEMLVTAADWGKKADGSSSGDYLEPANSCTVSVQVIYEDGTTNPAGTTAEDLKRTTIAYGYWSDGRGIGTLILSGLEGYQIWKIEAETGAETYASTSSIWGSFTVTNFDWDNNAMTVYEGEPVDSYIIHNDAHNPSTEGYYQNLMWDENYEAILIKIYVKAPVTEDSLTVHYMDQTANDLEFYSYNISVEQGTVFDKDFALGSGLNTLVNNSVTNILGVTQTVTADLSKMTEIGAQYRYSDYTCVKVVRSDDGKDVYLYYTFKNTHSFVIDFGLPLKITTVDLGITGDWTSATVAGAKYGSAVATVGEGVTYTPEKVLMGVETLQLTLTGSTGSVTHQIYICPASNVLYEAELFAKADNSNYWNQDITSDNEDGDPIYPVMSYDKDAKGKDYVYGYTDAYKGSVGLGMDGRYYAHVTESNMLTDILSFTFTGSGFDLIGSCGPDTGTLFVTVKDSSGAVKKIYIVNTAYKDKDYLTESGYIHQVPLVHTTELDFGTYTVSVNGAYVDYSATSNAQVAAFSMDNEMSSASSIDQVYSVLDELGVSYKDYDKLEFLGFEDFGASVSTFSMDAVTGNTAVLFSEENEEVVPDGALIVDVDAFRVYDGRNYQDTYYKDDEKNIQFVNVLDAVTYDNFAAYTETYPDYTATDRIDYERSGGPQNEIYLGANKSVVFNTTYEEGTVVQISARAVQGSAYMNGTQITSNTEMYYRVPVGSGGTLVIGNVGADNADGSNLLALGNLKIQAADTGSVTSVFEEVDETTLKIASVMLFSYASSQSTTEPEPDPVFEPAKLDVKVKSSSVLRNKIITVTITASTDVAKLTVNGKELKPTNSLMVKWGLSNTYTYVFTEVAKKTDTKSYEIIAYDKNGLASEPITVQG